MNKLWRCNMRMYNPKTGEAVVICICEDYDRSECVRVREKTEDALRKINFQGCVGFEVVQD